VPSVLSMTSIGQPARLDMSSEDAVKKRRGSPDPPSDSTAANHPRYSVCKQPATGNYPRRYNMFCSEQCVQKDKVFHQAFCKGFARLEARPNRSHVRAIYFPTQNDLPRFVWLGYPGTGKILLRHRIADGTADRALLRDSTVC
jgi:hypothetical protein